MFSGLDGDEELCLVLPDVSVGVVQKFLELFYTGFTSLMDKNDLAEFQDFMYNQVLTSFLIHRSAREISMQVEGAVFNQL